MQESTLSKAAAELGRRGGSAKTAAKKAAVAKNGELGGRPRQFRKCSWYTRKNSKGKTVPGSHRFDPETGKCACGWTREKAEL